LTRVDVELTGEDPWLRFEIHSLAKGVNHEVPMYACGNPCRVLLPRGKYRVSVTGSPEQAAGSREIDVTADGSWLFSLHDRGAAAGVWGRF